MSTSYPAALDSLTNPSSTDSLALPSHASQHANANDAIEAIETALGANLANMPLGRLGYAQVVASQGGITTEVDLTSLSVTVTAGTSRRLRITAQLLLSSTVATDHAGFSIKEGATQLNGTSAPFSGTASRNTTHYCAVSITPTSGSHTYKLTAARQAGTGTITMGASSTNPAFILVEDIGPA